MSWPPYFYNCHVDFGKGPALIASRAKEGTHNEKKLTHEQRHAASQHLKQVVRIQNSGSTAVAGPLFLVLDNLSGNASLANAEGTTRVLAPLGSSYVTVPIGGAGVLGPNESRTVTLEFAVTSSAPVTYDTRLLSVLPAP